MATERTPDGAQREMAIADSPSKPGDHVDVEALTGVIAAGYNPSPVRVELYERRRRK